jgi:ABC-type transport system substrate-binding protein
MAERSYWDRTVGRRIGRRGLLRGGAALGVLSLGAGCTTTAPSAAPTSAPAATAASGAAGPAATPTAAAVQRKYGGVIRMAVSGAAPHLDVHRTATFSLHSQGPSVVYSRLIRYKIGPESTGSGAQPTGDLAESWEQVDDLTYVFKLRPGVKFQNIAPVNGRELVAEDILFSHQRQRAERVNAGFLAAIGRWEAPDKATVKLTLSRPDADFLIDLADGHNVIIAKEIIDQRGDLQEGPSVGTGPYILEKWDPNSGTFVVKNPDYFIKGVPYVDRYERLRIPDEAARQTALRAKQLDTLGFGITPPDAKRLRDENPSLKQEDTISTGSGFEMGLKCDRPPFNDARLRQAVAKALDRQAIVDTVFLGAGWLTAGLTLPAVDWALPEAEAKQLFARDLAAARRLLGEAGQASGFEVDLQVANYGQSYLTGAELIAAQLKEVGINLRIRPITPAEYNQNIIAEGNYQMYVAPTQPVPTANGDLNSRHKTGGSRNHFKFSDPRLDEMIDRQAVMVKDPEGRKRILLDIQRSIANSAHLIMLSTSKGLNLTWDYVKDFDVGATSGAELMQTALAWIDK